MVVGPQLAFVHDEGPLAPIQTDKIQGTSSWLSELAPRRAAAGMSTERKVRLCVYGQRWGGSEEGGVRPARMAWDMGWAWAWAWAWV